MQSRSTKEPRPFPLYSFEPFQFNGLHPLAYNLNGSKDINMTKRRKKMLRVVELKRDANGCLGLNLAGQRPCCIESVNHNSPAEKAGLCSSDKIILINGKDVRQWSHEEIIEEIGTSSERVTLAIHSKNKPSFPLNHLKEPNCERYSNYKSSTPKYAPYYVMRRPERDFQDFSFGEKFDPHERENISEESCDCPECVPQSSPHPPYFPHQPLPPSMFHESQDNSDEDNQENHNGKVFLAKPLMRQPLVSNSSSLNQQFFSNPQIKKKKSVNKQSLPPSHPLSFQSKFNHEKRNKYQSHNLTKSFELERKKIKSKNINKKSETRVHIEDCKVESNILSSDPKDFSSKNKDEEESCISSVSPSGLPKLLLDKNQNKINKENINNNEFPLQAHKKEKKFSMVKNISISEDASSDKFQPTFVSLSGVSIGPVVSKGIKQEDSLEENIKKEENKKKVKENERDEKKNEKINKEENNEIKTKENSNIKAWLEDFNILLKDKKGVQLFGKFLSSELCLENLNFYLACENLKCQVNQLLNSSPSSKLSKNKLEILDSLVKLASNIYDTHLNDEAQEQINVDYIIKTNLYSSLQLLQDPLTESREHLLKTLFNEAQTHIFQLMKQDKYPRFKASDFVKRALSRENQGLPFFLDPEIDRPPSPPSIHQKTKKSKIKQSFQPKKPKAKNIFEGEFNFEEKRKSWVFWQKKKIGMARQSIGSTKSCTISTNQIYKSYNDITETKKEKNKKSLVSFPSNSTSVFSIAKKEEDLEETGQEIIGGINSRSESLSSFKSDQSSQNFKVPRVHLVDKKNKFPQNKFSQEKISRSYSSSSSLPVAKETKPANNLIDLLAKAQSWSLEEQRGKIKTSMLVIPDFLKLKDPEQEVLTPDDKPQILHDNHIETETNLSKLSGEVGEVCPDLMSKNFLPSKRNENIKNITGKDEIDEAERDWLIGLENNFSLDSEDENNLLPSVEEAHFFFSGSASLKPLQPIERGETFS